jgi:hypothetical protein
MRLDIKWSIGGFVAVSTLLVFSSFVDLVARAPKPGVSFTVREFNSPQSEDVIAVALNADNAADLITAHFHQRSLITWIGDGAGQFTAAATIDTPGRPVRLSAADFDRDGELDLAVVLRSDAGAGSVAIYKGNASGGFLLDNSISVGEPDAITCTDIDGDGYTDIVLTIPPEDKLRLLFGTGSTFFGVPQEVEAGSSPHGVAVADFNGDGQTDLAVTNYVIGASTVTLLISNGARSFTRLPPVPSGQSSTGVVAADLNRDGRVDLAVSNSTSGEVSTLIGVGGAVFRLDRTISMSGSGAFAVAIGNFDGNDILDLAVANSRTGTASFVLGETLRNGKSKSIGYRPAQIVLHSPGAWRVIAPDMNGDGRSDLVVISEVGPVGLISLLNTTGQPSR